MILPYLLTRANYNLSTNVAHSAKSKKKFSTIYCTVYTAARRYLNTRLGDRNFTVAGPEL